MSAVGDLVIFTGVFDTTPIHRRWWQFWKPRVSYAPKMFQITALPADSTTPTPKR